MKKLLVLAILGTFSGAFATQIEDAVVTAGSFDGKTYSFEGKAYNMDNGLKVNVISSCDYGQLYGVLYVKAINIRINLIDSGKIPTQKEVPFKGQVNVRDLLDNKCNNLAGLDSALPSPVEIRLPKISISSRQ